jgi:hypothetical protein
MPECPDCLAEDRPLHPSGRCHQCETFFSPDKFKWEPRGDFKWEVSYDGPLETLVCLSCGGDRFIVGRKAYRTAARCEKCGWERCIHDG